MIAAALPAPLDPAEPPAQARPPKGAPFAAVIDAVPADATAEPGADTPDKGDAAATPGADAPAVTSPGAPTIVADATALIAQLSPPPAAAATIAPAGIDDSPISARHPREGGSDPIADGKAAPRAKAARSVRTTSPAVLELASDPAAGFADASGAAHALPTRVAEATLTVDPHSAAPLADVAITHHLDMAHDAQWLDRLAQDIARSADAGANLRFSLSPEHLGRLTVDLAAGADGTAVRLTTESEAAHRIVSEAQPRLVAEARAQGLRISETQVDLDQRQSGQQHPQRSLDGQGGQDRARPAVLWTELPRRAGAVAHGVPAARDLYA